MGLNRGPLKRERQDHLGTNLVTSNAAATNDETLKRGGYLDGHSDGCHNHYSPPLEKAGFRSGLTFYGPIIVAKMKCYIISYDLTDGDDYKSLFKAIKAYRTWAHITESTWAVVTDQSAKEIRENLARYLPGKSALFVVLSGSESAWQSVICRDAWLKEHL